MTVLDWLLDSDPAIRWQVLRDLVDAPAEVVAAERARVANEGWGARLLALQGEDGQWAGGACFPGRFFAESDQYEGQPWTSTLPTLQLLHDFGVEPGDDRVRRAVALVALMLVCRSRVGRGRQALCRSKVRTSPVPSRSPMSAVPVTFSSCSGPSTT